LTEERYLVETLQELGNEPEVCGEGKFLLGYLGDERSERAQVIIPRRQLDPASNDIGFANMRNAAHQLGVEFQRQLEEEGWPVLLHIGILSRSKREQIESLM